MSEKRLAAAEAWSSEPMNSQFFRLCGPLSTLVGYLRYDDRHADLFYEVVRQRYQRGASMVLTTNKPFSEWNTVFESAACLVTLIDRLCHRCEIVEIAGPSYRSREAKERASRKRARRRKVDP